MFGIMIEALMNDIVFYPHIHVFFLRITLAYGISLEDKLSFLHSFFAPREVQDTG